MACQWRKKLITSCIFNYKTSSLPPPPHSEKWSMRICLFLYMATLSARNNKVHVDRCPPFVSTLSAWALPWRGGLHRLTISGAMSAETLCSWQVQPNRTGPWGRCLTKHALGTPGKGVWLRANDSELYIKKRSCHGNSDESGNEDHESHLGRHYWDILQWAPSTDWPVTDKGGWALSPPHTLAGVTAVSSSFCLSSQPLPTVDHSHWPASYLSWFCVYLVLFWKRQLSASLNDGYRRLRML